MATNLEECQLEQRQKVALTRSSLSMAGLSICIYNLLPGTQVISFREKYVDLAHIKL